MNRSISTRHMRQFSKSPSKRGLYINTEVNKREKNTTFHSPYKDGRPNKDYTNPSFISSHLFYPKDYLDNKQITVQNNYAPNSNDIKKQALYRQRIMTEHNPQELPSAREKSITKRQREYSNVKNGNNNKIAQKSPQKKLAQELQTLYDYRESRKERDYQVPEGEVPIYLQKLRGDNSYEIKKQTDRQREMREWIELTSQLKQIKQEMQRSTRTIENERFNKQIEEGRQQQQQQQRQRRKQSQILANILREQMRWDRQRRVRHI